MLGLLEAALDGDSEALSGYADVTALHDACAKLARQEGGWTTPQRLRMLTLSVVPPIGLQACVAAIRKLPMSQLGAEMDQVVVLLTTAATRHLDASGNVCAEVGQAIEICVSAGCGQSEVGDQAAWLLLDRLLILKVVDWRAHGLALDFLLHGELIFEGRASKCVKVLVLVGVHAGCTSGQRAEARSTAARSGAGHSRRSGRA